MQREIEVINLAGWGGSSTPTFPMCYMGWGGWQIPLQKPAAEDLAVGCLVSPCRQSHSPSLQTTGSQPGCGHQEWEEHQQYQTINFYSAAIHLVGAHHSASGARVPLSTGTCAHTRRACSKQPSWLHSSRHTPSTTHSPPCRKAVALSTHYPSGANDACPSHLACHIAAPPPREGGGQQRTGLHPSRRSCKEPGCTWWSWKGGGIHLLISY